MSLVLTAKKCEFEGNRPILFYGYGLGPAWWIPLAGTGGLWRSTSQGYPKLDFYPSRGYRLLYTRGSSHSKQPCFHPLEREMERKNPGTSVLIDIYKMAQSWMSRWEGFSSASVDLLASALDSHITVVFSHTHSHSERKFSKMDHYFIII